MICADQSEALDADVYCWLSLLVGRNAQEYVRTAVLVLAR